MLGTFLLLACVACSFTATAYSFSFGPSPFSLPPAAKASLHSSQLSATASPATASPDSNKRRNLLLSTSLLLPLLLPPSPALAQLQRFPPDRPLLNTYHFLRAGSSLLESEGTVLTNPLFQTNRENALSPAGLDQVAAAVQQLRECDTPPTVVKYALSAKCQDAARIVGDSLGIGRSSNVAEFTFLDGRALGSFDGLPASEVAPAVAWMDAVGPGRPPPADDGTPNEDLADVAVRLRQLLSATETQFSGESILLIFPDGAGPSLLLAMLQGVPAKRAHEREFREGQLLIDAAAVDAERMFAAKPKGWDAYLRRGEVSYGKILRGEVGKGGDNSAGMSATGQKELQAEEEGRRREVAEAAAEKVEGEAKAKAEREAEREGKRREKDRLRREGGRGKGKGSVRETEVGREKTLAAVVAVTGVASVAVLAGGGGEEAEGEGEGEGERERGIGERVNAEEEVVTGDAATIVEEEETSAETEPIPEPPPLSPREAAAKNAEEVMQAAEGVIKAAEDAEDDYDDFLKGLMAGVEDK